MKHLFPLVLGLSLLSIQAAGQSYSFATDAQQRGYYNRPYLRYEAEPTYCVTNGTFLPASDDQRDIQSEASHQQALVLKNAGDYVEWTLDAEADGLTLRFSLPDNAEGTGLIGTLTVEIGESSAELPISSYWAWQYTKKSGGYPADTYPTNTPAPDAFARMYFDEVHALLPQVLPAGSVIRLTKAVEDSIPYTIDFIEMEKVPAPITFEDIADTNKIAYDPNTDGDLADFVNAHPSQTIYLPQGRIETAKRIYMNKNNTHLIGAGMWYTEIYFTASSDNSLTFDKRGIEASGSNLLLEGVYLNTINNKRYYNNQDSKQVGKGVQGCWGKNSVIRNCWIEHFECGGWIADYSAKGSENLLVEHCRMRNNYADGINFSQASINHTCQYCSFRNNGDDDMASWTTARTCKDITFAYCTAENNWRASSLGFFGGEKHHAHHLAIYDAVESGVRVNADFQGNGFSDTGNISIHDVTIVHSGCKGGSRGTAGDFWGNMQGALNIGGTQYYDVKNIRLADIDIIDSRGDAIYLRAGSGKKLINLSLSDIHVDGAGRWGLYYSGATGTARYCNLTFDNCVQGDMSTHMPSFVVTTDCEEEPNDLQSVCNSQPDLPVAIYDITGRLTYSGPLDQVQLTRGIYIVCGIGRIKKLYIQ